MASGEVGTFRPPHSSRPATMSFLPYAFYIPGGLGDSVPQSISYSDSTTINYPGRAHFSEVQPEQST